ncbi:hypothetical protein PHLCEN_2v3835 [Hermanssonia centrifuga]|uniref:Major facilitator superfamily (MFS) profile domain-containing protein n=1 Tax=Hermanssonia centrifuga TaxID=98765 RepID=A0A2R6QBG2_9APHY|nr:hypothetical protein PHLCEN_2v3835 [Hermanssonia centrifuga]
MFWGTMADRWGRRPMFLACMLVLALACVGLALVPTNAYWLLMLLRCLQAAGSASTVALGAGVIADIAVRSERGSFFGLYSLGPMVGPCIGPVIGGILAGSLGWSFLPETLRSLVGDGSIRPHPFHRPLIPIIGRTISDSEAAVQEKPPKTPFTNPLRLFLSPVITLLLIFNAVLCAVFYGVTASISTLFVEAYPFLTEIEIGLCFLAIGGGMLFGSCFTGRILDKEYRKVKENLEQKCRDDFESTMKPEDVTKDENFRIEYARLRTMPIYYVLFVVACIAYGWCLDRKVNIAGPLILQILSKSF